jgi:hypothetical protein
MPVGLLFVFAVIGACAFLVPGAILVGLGNALLKGRHGESRSSGERKVATFVMALGGLVVAAGLACAGIAVLSALLFWLQQGT